MRDYNAEYQDNASRKYSYDFDSIIRSYMMRTLAPHFMQGRALEIGCFEGASTLLFAEHFEDLTVIEASDELIAIAKERVPARVAFVNATIDSAIMEPVYDAIFLVHTLEHLDNPAANLARISS